LNPHLCVRSDEYSSTAGETNESGDAIEHIPNPVGGGDEPDALAIVKQ
jgi:hypothetical protein